VNGPWSESSGAWVGHFTAWQPIVTTVAVGAAGLSSEVRPALAGDSLGAAVSTARHGLHARTAVAAAGSTAFPGPAGASLAGKAATALAEQLAVVTIVTTGDGLAARPALAAVASWAVSARAGLSARAHAAGHSAVTGTAVSLGIVCRPGRAGASASAEAMAEAVALTLALRQSAAGTGVREVLRLCSPLTTAIRLASPLATRLGLLSAIDIEQT